MMTLSCLQAGTANNIVPQEVTLTFDVRLGTSVNETEFEAQVRKFILLLLQLKEANVFPGILSNTVV